MKNKAILTLILRTTCDKLNEIGDVMAYEFELPKVIKTTRAQETLQSALVDLMSEKSLMSITVREVCARAYVARSTFYAYYQSIDDILKEIEDLHLYNLVVSNDAIFNTDLVEPSDLSYYTQTLNYISQNASVFSALLIKNPDYRFINKWKSAIKHHFYERFFKEKQIKNEDFVLDTIASIIISFDTYWLQNPQKVDINEVYDMVYSLLRMIL